MPVLGAGKQSSYSLLWMKEHGRLLFSPKHVRERAIRKSRTRGKADTEWTADGMLAPSFLNREERMLRTAGFISTRSQKSFCAPFDCSSGLGHEKLRAILPFLSAGSSRASLGCVLPRSSDLCTVQADVSLAVAAAGLA